MKFKKEQLYRVVKDRSPSCIGCLLRYKGADNRGKVIKPREKCKNRKVCPVFKFMLVDPNKYKLVEYESMVDFCKKLKKQRSK